MNLNGIFLSPITRKLFVFGLFLPAPASAEFLYETDFDDFPVGPNQWSSAPEWFSNDNTSGAQSIDDDVLPALLKTASLGFTRPANPFTAVFLDLGFDPASAPSPLIEIDTLIGIEDSTNNRRDDFFLTFYNSNGDRLASIRFDNESPLLAGSQFGIWRENSNTQFDTQVDFITGELFNLFATINLESNTWSADVDGLPLFDNVEFTNRAGPLDLGFLAFEWDLTSTTTFGFGDNFLLVADLFVRNITSAPVPLAECRREPSGDIRVSWQTAVGWTDQLQFSTDLVTWSNDLPGSTFANVTVSSTVSVTAASPARGPKRYYRVHRTPAQ